MSFVLFVVKPHWHPLCATGIGSHYPLETPRNRNEQMLTRDEKTEVQAIRILSRLLHYVICPQGFDVVEIARLFSENVHDDIAIVEDHPALLPDAFAVERLVGEV